jgi:hypothetical protein
MRPGLAVGWAVALALLAGCAGELIVVDPGPGAARPGKVPPGHMPPPGKCRIWHPDRPPGHQPPPGDCGELRERVPPGATLIRG